MARYFKLKVLGSKALSGHLVSVDKCARCGQDHGAMEFSILKNAPNASWTACPETDEPIIIGNKLFDYKEQLLSILGQATESNKSFSTAELRKRFKLMDLLEKADSEDTILIDDVDMKFLQDFMNNFTGWLAANKDIVQFLDDIESGGTLVTRQEEKRAKRNLRVINEKNEDLE